MFDGEDVQKQGSNRSSRSQRRSKHYHRPIHERGWIQFLVLRILHEEPMHGYRIMEDLEDRELVVKGRFESPSIYNILKRMERRGLLTSEKVKTESERIRRVYSITSKGEDTLKEGLISLIKRKKITDKLIDYYNEKFSQE